MSTRRPLPPSRPLPPRRSPQTEPTVRQTPAYDPTVISPKPAGRAPASPIERALPPEAAQADPSARFGKFIRTKKLGAGGMGEVWKAYDTELARWVALKFLKGGDDEEIARFLREAQTAGRLSHPNIAAIFDVGQNQGRHWIAMQFVPGQTLKTLPRRDRPLLVRLVRDAARALEYAHGEGVIHRDVKPDNLMVVRTEKGDARLFVMDFGLARPAEGASDLSMSGLVVGTPAYMAPEQARGQRVDARADVWSLGATLYELLGDRVPFRGPNVLETLKLVQDADPKPLRAIDPKIGRELETIVTKCLEKDPARRYGSAAELADELDRFLAGDAILAHPPSVGYRIRKALVRRKALVATIAACALLLAVVVAVFGRSLTRASERLSSAQEEVLRQMRTITQISLDAAILKRRAKDREGMTRYLEQVRQECGKVIGEIPRLAEPHYRLGRMQRVVGNDAQALEEQDRAVAKEPSYAPALYERIILNGRTYRLRAEDRYQEALAKLGRSMFSIQGGSIQETRRGLRPSLEEAAEADPELQSIRRRMSADLATLRAGRNRDGLSAAQSACAEGWAAWIAGDRETAKRHLEGAARSGGADEEVHEALAELEFELARNDAGYRRAVARLTEGLAREPGFAPFLELRGWFRVCAGISAMDEGGNPAEWFGDAVADFTEAIDLRPGETRPLLRRAAARANLGLYRKGRGEDPSDQYRAALEDLDEILKRRPETTQARIDRGLIRANWGNHQLARGSDPEEHYEGAIRDLSEAIRQKSGIAEAWRGRGSVRANWAGYRVDRGEPAIELYRAAVTDLDEALKLDPTHAETWRCRGAARCNWAYDLADRAKDPGELFESAISDLIEAIKLRPRDDLAWQARGHARVGLAEQRLRQGREGEAFYREACRDYDMAIEINPHWYDHWERRASLLARIGNLLIRTRRDPTDFYEAAIRDCSESHRLNPQTDVPLTRRAGVRTNLAAYRQKTGGDPEPLFVDALRDYEEALKIRRNRADTWIARGQMYWNLAAHLYGHKRPCADQFQAALDSFLEALRIDPRREAELRPQIDEARQAVADNRPR